MLRQVYLKACNGASWAIFVPSWGHLGFRWGHLGPRPGPKSGENARNILQISLLGRLETYLEGHLSHLGPFALHLDLILGRLGPSWNHLAATLGHLGPSWGILSRFCDTSYAKSQFL